MVAAVSARRPAAGRPLRPPGGLGGLADGPVGSRPRWIRRPNGGPATVHDADHPGGPGGSGDGGNPATSGRVARDRGGRGVPVLLLALAFVLTAGIGITLGSVARLSRQGRLRPAAGRRLGGGLGVGVGRGGAHRRHRRGARPAALPTTPAKTLNQALTLLDTTVWTTGYLPPKSCTYARAVSAKCSAPYPGITVAFFQNYSSPDALYRAYAAAIKQANSGRLVINTQDCGAWAPGPTARRSPGTTSACTRGITRSSSWRRAS